MGMFDYLHFVSGENDNTPLCAQGHQVKTFQTKSLQSVMSTYLVYEGKLYVKDSGLVDKQALAKEDITKLSVKGEDVIVNCLKQLYKHCPITCCCLIYEDCTECTPIYVKSNTPNWSSIKYQTHSPWVEWELLFIDGILSRMKPTLANQSLTDLRESLALQGCLILEEDHPQYKTIVGDRDFEE